MASRRVARVAEQIQQEVARLLLFEARDPRLKAVTITNARVSPDLSVARLYYLPTTHEVDRDQLAQALDRARGFLRHELGLRLRLRRVPELHFHADEVIEHGRRMEAVFDEMDTRSDLDAPEAPDAAAGSHDPGTPDEAPTSLDTGAPDDAPGPGTPEDAPGPGTPDPDDTDDRE